MTKLAIKGHPTRGDEVIALLTMLGGYTETLQGNGKNNAYSISESSYIYFINSVIPPEGYRIFTLEEFLKKYPYKIGSKVTYAGWNCTVIGMEWENNTDTILYTVKGIDFSKCVYVENLQSDKKEAMEKIKDNWAKWDLPNGYEFQDKDGNIINTSVIKLVKKQPQYPKTYVECAKILDCFSAAHIDGYKNTLLEKLQELLVCRNAYWKIAGEQMGLSKPWEPNWKKSEERRYSIVNIADDINLPETTLTKWILKVTNKILVFPTKEMRDAFYENFKNLIEACKELL